MMLHIPAVLTKPQVQEFRHRLAQAEWVDGRATAGAQSTQVKRNRQLPELSPLAQELERAFDPAGKLLDTASALLADLRERARGLHRAIKQRIEELLKDEKIVPMLRDEYYSVRGDRYVLPVRAEHRTHLPGIVHNASNSGQTLFVEPQQLVELGNQLTIAEASALEEEQRILKEQIGRAHV